MLIFGNDVKNAIIDASSDADLMENVQKFQDDVEMLFIYFGYPITDDYIRNLLSVKKNKCAFWSEGAEGTDIASWESSIPLAEASRETKFPLKGAFDIRCCKTGLIYACYQGTCYIMLICTNPEEQKKGYATKTLKAFIESMRGKVSNILLSSVDYAVSYYQCIGFEAIDDNLDNYPYLRAFEISSPNKISTIMEYRLI